MLMLAVLSPGWSVVFTAIASKMDTDINSHVMYTKVFTGHTVISTKTVVLCTQPCLPTRQSYQQRQSCYVLSSAYRPHSCLSKDGCVMYLVGLSGQTVKTTKTGVLCTEMCLLTLQSPVPATTSKGYTVPTVLNLDQRICM